MTSRRAGALAEMYGAAKYKPVKLFQLRIFMNQISQW